jgi:hypothetical protein
MVIVYKEKAFALLIINSATVLPLGNLLPLHHHLPLVTELHITTC